MSFWRSVVIGVAAVYVVACPQAASARSVTTAEYHKLLARAEQDPSVAVKLREVTSVDGRPVDMERALAGAEGDELADRLRALAENQPSSTQVADPARLARRILSRPEFRAEGEDGLAGGLQRFLAPIRQWLGEVVPRILNAPVVVALAVVVVLASVVTAARLATSRAKGAASARHRPSAVEPEDAAALEHSAAEAERCGELEQALRLRFRAGLLRLGEAGLIEFSPSLTSGQVARRLGSPTFTAASRAFDEVVYGRRAVSKRDLDVVRRVPLDVPREVAA